MRTVVAGDTVAGASVRIEPAIEVGNIFKLGTRYCEPLGATYLDEAGRSQLVWMGSYGFGPARAAAAAVEQYADEHGISWPRSIAPFDVELVVLGKPGSPERELADRLYHELGEAGLQTLYDERDAGPGEKFTDAELLGCPVRLTVGRRTLAAEEIEVQIRRGRESRSVPAERSRRGCGRALARAALSRIEGPSVRGGNEMSPRITKRRLFGLDRSGPPPAATLLQTSRCAHGRSPTRSATCGWPGSRCSWSWRSPAPTGSRQRPRSCSRPSGGRTTWTGSRPG